LVTGTKYSGVIFIKMTDLGTPVVGSNDTTGDFAVVLGGALIPKTTPTLTNLGGNLWALRFENVSVTVVSQSYGLIRYNTNSGRGFTITGLNVWASTVGFPYIKNSGGTYLDVTDYTLAADGKVTATVMPEVGAELHWVPTTVAPATGIPQASVTGLVSDVARITALEGNRAKLNAITHEIRGSYQPTAQFTPTIGGAADLTGTSDYSYPIIGWYAAMPEDSIFDTLKVRMWSTTAASNVEWKLWVRDTAGSFDTTSVTPDASGTMLSADFPIANTLVTLDLGTKVYAAAGKVVVLLVRKTNGLYLSCRIWSNDVAGRHGFILSSSTSWPSTFSFSSAPTYAGTEFLLTLEQGASAVPATSSSVDIVLPPTIYTVVGRESNIYLDNIIAQDASDYFWDVTCTQGLHQQERWTSGLTPTAGNTTISFSAYPKNSETAIGSRTAAMVVKSASAGSGLNRKVLVIGDSTTAGGITTGEMVNLFSTDAMAITLLGTKGSGANRHEGIAGWTVNQFYTDATSPFVFSGAFNFSTYMSTNGYAAVDWVLINLGINDVFGLTSDADVDTKATAMIAQLEAMITNIHVFDANVRIGIAVTTPPIATQDGFGTNYGCGQNRWRFKRNIVRLARKLIDNFQGREATASKVYIVPLSVCIDTLHNMIQVTVAVNSRNTATVTRLNNGIHPDTPGYYQCADAYYAFLKGNET
jgi:lysophospholipase L1-like esterase